LDFLFETAKVLPIKLIKIGVLQESKRLQLAKGLSAL
jgi:hypothetical protein